MTHTRELTADEIDAVNGAWVANAAGAIVGGIGGGVMGFASSGGDWRGAASGAIGGAIVGGINPLRGVVGAAHAARVLHASAVGGVAGAGVKVFT